MRMARPVILCTGNKNKLKELLNILGPEHKNKIKCQDVDLPEYQGEPEEIALAKCKLAAEHFKAPVIVEDVSLCFNALGGMPGPYIKWFLKNLGAPGLPKLLTAYEDKTAYAQCIVAYSSGEKDAKIHLFDGRCPGQIVEPRGSTEFGWDPVFQPEGYTQTYAEMTPETKNKISHRSKAILGLKDFFLRQSNERM